VSAIVLATQLEILFESSFHGIDEIGRYGQNRFTHKTASSYRLSRIIIYCMTKVHVRTVSRVTSAEL